MEGHMKVIAFVVSYRSESSFPLFLLHSHGALRCTSAHLFSVINLAA